MGGLCIPTQLTPGNNSKHQVLGELWQHLACVVTYYCDSTGRGQLVVCAWFLLDFAHVSLPFADSVSFWHNESQPGS